MFDYSQGVIPPPILRSSQRSFGDSLGDVLANEFKTWSVVFNLSYPIGTSAADAGLAQTRAAARPADDEPPRSRDDIVAQVRDAGRQVTTALKRVETTQKARELAEQNLQAEEKRLAVGLSDDLPRHPGPARPDRPAQ